MFEQRRKELREKEEEQALLDKKRLEAAKIIADDPNAGCEVKIGGLNVGISVNTRIKEVLDAEIAEINAYLNGEKNFYE